MNDVVFLLFSSEGKKIDVKHVMLKVNIWVFRRRAALVIVVVYEHATLCTSRKMFLPEFLGLQSTYRIFKLRKKQANV